MREDTPSWILQRQVTEAKSDVAPMRNWGLCISAAIKHFSPYIIQSAHKTALQTKNNACMLYKSFAGAHSLQALKWHFPLYSKPWSGWPTIATSRRFRKYSIWLRQQEWRREQQTFVPNLKLHYTNAKNQWPSITSIETLLLLFTTRSALIKIQAECPDLRRI